MKKIIIIIVFGALLLTGSGFFVFADFDYNICYDTNLIDKKCSNLSDDECMSIFEECDQYLERKLAEHSRDLTITEAEKQSLQYQINRLQGEINHLSAQINRNRLVIQNLGLKIADTQGSIIKTTEKIEKSREELAEMLRTINMEGRASVIEIILTEDNLSEVFSSLNSLERLSGETKGILDEVKELRRSLYGYKEELEDDKEQTEMVARIQIAQKEEEEAARREQERLYGMTEAEYQKQLAEKQELEKKAEEIRQRIFQLVGLLPDVKEPTFEEAYDIAKWVEERTGVRAALILAVLHQESGIGRNVGECYLKDTTTADGINIKTGATVRAVMKPMGLPGRDGDVDSFLIITRELGLDPFNTPVSCPIPSVGGYGGAMGPAQFIPTTWIRYRGRLTTILGHHANPWNIRDSFLATGLYLQDYGAWTKTRDAEWCAAQGYFTGIRCNPNHAFYGNNVLSIADRFEKDIELMTK